MNSPLNLTNIQGKPEARTHAVTREVRSGLPWQCHQHRHPHPALAAWGSASPAAAGGCGAAGRQKRVLVPPRAGLIPAAAMAEEEEAGSNSVSPILQHCFGVICSS